MTKIRSFAELDEPASELPLSSARVLATKLYPPRLRAHGLTRNQLIEKIGFGFERPIVVIESPPGYGKSTLAARWGAKSSHPVAWVSLDKSDDDFSTFFTLLIASLQTVDAAIGHRATELLRSSGSESEPDVVRALVEDLASTSLPFAIVFDDYHLIESIAVHSAMEMLLRHLPHVMRVFFLGRSAPGISLAKHRSRGELVEIGREDLRFTNAEAIDLMNREEGIELTPGETVLLNERAEGWPAGLQLISHLLQGKSRTRVEEIVAEFSGVYGPIASFLWEETLKGLPSERLDFLLRTAILDRFTTELADRMLERSDSGEQIRQLQLENLFVIPLDVSGNWFRYHHLFRDVLMDKLSANVREDEVELLHRKASLWLEENGARDEAARHAVAGGEWSRAAELLEPIAGELYVADNISTLRARLDGLPLVILEQSPTLAFALAWALARSGRIEQSLAPLRLAEQRWIMEGDDDNLGRVAVLRCLQNLLASNFQQSVTMAERASNLLQEHRYNDRATACVFKAAAYLGLGYPVLAEEALTESSAEQLGRSQWVRDLESVFSGVALISRGSLSDACTLFQNVIRSERPINSMQVQQALAQLGNAYLERNLLEEAEGCYRQGIKLSDVSGAFLWRGRFHLGLSKFFRVKGDIEVAFAEVEQAIQISEQLGSPQESRNARAFQAQLWLDSGQLALVRRWADRNGLGPFWNDTYERFFEQVTYIRLLLLEENQSELAVKLLESLLSRAVSCSRINDVIEIEVLRAIALKSIGRSTESLAALEHAMNLGEPNGYVRTFLNEGEMLAPLLRHLSTRRENRDYARKLLALIDGSPSDIRPFQPSQSESLSEREIEVLRLVSAGMPNRAIGERLYITEKTVKKHISNIMGKLQTTNRTQAVEQARRRGLLSD